MAAVRAELADAEARIACRVTDVIILHDVAAAAVDPDAVGSPHSDHGVVRKGGGVHRRVVDGRASDDVVVDGVDCHSIVAGAADEVVGGAQMVSHTASDIVEVDPVGPHGVEPAV